jgi:hypothetical protein
MIRGHGVQKQTPLDTRIIHIQHGKVFTLRSTDDLRWSEVECVWSLYQQHLGISFKMWFGGSSAPDLLNSGGEQLMFMNPSSQVTGQPPSRILLRVWNARGDCPLPLISPPAPLLCYNFTVSIIIIVGIKSPTFFFIMPLLKLFDQHASF